MMYDRVQVKQAARAAVRGNTPPTWKVTLVLFLLTGLLPGVLTLLLFLMLPPEVTLSSGGFSFHYEGAGAVPYLFLNILSALFSVVLSFGYHRYALLLERRRPGGYGELYGGFAMAGRVIALNLLIFLFAFLWCLLGLAVLLLAGSLLIYLAPLLAVGLCVFLINRILRYEMAVFVLIDEPECGALEALDRSKALMKGRLGSYFMLELSFFGWRLLAGLITAAVVLAGFALMGESLYDYRSVNAWVLEGLLLLGGICAAPLNLWLTGYVATAEAGFYDAALRWEGDSGGGELPPREDPAQSEGGPDTGPDRPI